MKSYPFLYIYTCDFKTSLLHENNRNEIDLPTVY